MLAIFGHGDLPKAGEIFNLARGAVLGAERTSALQITFAFETRSARFRDTRLKIPPPLSPPQNFDSSVFTGCKLCSLYTSSTMAFQPFDPGGEVRSFRHHLPHWGQIGVTYFVITRLADSVPQSVLRQWSSERDAWLRAHHCTSSSDAERLPEPIRREYHARFTAKFHEYLDEGSGDCWLRRPEFSAIVSGAVRHFDQERYQLDAFIVMPSEVLLQRDSDSTIGGPS